MARFDCASAVSDQNFKVFSSEVMLTSFPAELVPDIPRTQINPCLHPAIYKLLEESTGEKLDEILETITRFGSNGNVNTVGLFMPYVPVPR